MFENLMAELKQDAIDGFHELRVRFLFCLMFIVDTRSRSYTYARNNTDADRWKI